MFLNLAKKFICSSSSPIHCSFLKTHQRRIGTSMSNKILFIGLALVLPICNAQAQTRTVTDNEAASWFEKPSFPWHDLGAYIGSPQSTLAPEAVRGIMGHFDKFYQAEDPAEGGSPEGFPYSKLRAYEAAQVAAG